MGCQDVCVSMHWDGGNEFYREDDRRAKKAYKCCECQDPIAIGEIHNVATGKNSDGIFTNRTCAPCSEIRLAFCCDGWLFGELWESIREQLFPYWDEMKAIDCLAKLTTDAAIAKMREEFDQFKEDQAC